MHIQTQYPSVSHSGDMSVRRSRRTTTSTKITTAATMTTSEPVVVAWLVGFYLAVSER